MEKFDKTMVDFHAGTAQFSNFEFCVSTNIFNEEHLHFAAHAISASCPFETHVLRLDESSNLCLNTV